MRDSTLPSWVPDFGHWGSDVFESLAMDDKFQASKGSIAAYAVFPDESRLKLKGYLLTKVVQTCQSDFDASDFHFPSLLRFAKGFGSHTADSTWFEDFVHTITTSKVAKLPYTTLRDSLEQFFAVMIFAERPIQRWVGRFWRNDDINAIMEKAYQNALDMVTTCSGSCISPRKEGLNENLRQLQHLGTELIDSSDVEVRRNKDRHEFVVRFKSVREAIDRGLHRRRLLATTIGAIGNGPEKALPGDEIWILHGARVPILLRPTGEQTKVVVGETYIHGMMNGEPFNSRLLSFDDPEIITLR